MGGCHRAKLLLDLEPHRHRIDAYEFAGDARQKQLASVFAFEQGTKGVRHLEASLVIDARRRVAPKHATLLHFCPKISTEIVWKALEVVNRKRLLNQ